MYSVHLRRGIEHFLAARSDEQPVFGGLPPSEGQNGGQKVIQIPPGPVALVMLTAILFFFVSVAIEYSYGEVVATLTMVESETADVLLSTSAPADPPSYTEEPETDDPVSAAKPFLNNNNNRTNPTPGDAEMLVVKNKPLTSSFRTIIRHLKERAGWTSRFRGAHIAFIQAILLQFVMGLIPVRHGAVSAGLGILICSIVLSPIQIAWVHKVISEPAPIRWYRRIPSLRTTGKVVVPTAIAALARALAMYIPLQLASTIGLLHTLKDSQHLAQRYAEHPGKILGETILVSVVYILAVIGIAIPAHISLVRVYASLLPEEEESIVPFDRTFGGKVQPAITGGSGMVSLLDAWKSFNWNSRKRIIICYAKVFAMQIALWSLGFLVIGLEANFTLAPALKKALQGEGDEPQF